jgi:UDP-glucuronate 4-epimerase
MKILLTGAAGFIGMHTAQRLLKEGHEVIGLDNINSYYDTNLKYGRLNELGIPKSAILYNKILTGHTGFKFIELDLNDAGNLMALFAKQQFDIVINLAAQAGVRYSITNPKDYIESNIVGFFNLLECCRTFVPKHLIYASSSSVYGNSTEVPFRTTNNTDSPVSLYAATKKTNELMAYTYSHLYSIPCTGLRFFTVYGPWGRPDMAYFSFTKNIIEQQPISLYNNGNLKRDFTYIDDIVESIVRLIPKTPVATSNEAAYRLINIGNQNPVEVSTFVSVLETCIGKKATIESTPMQPGDVYTTYADTSEIESITGFTPNTSIEKGLQRFVNWFKSHYSIKN